MKEFEPEVCKCWASVTRDGITSQINKVDMIFEDGIPWAVLEWLDTHDGAVESVKVRLDRRWLDTMPDPECPYLYQMPIEWPGEPA